jgi:hypothetical protein
VFKNDFFFLPHFPLLLHRLIHCRSLWCVITTNDAFKFWLYCNCYYHGFSDFLLAVFSFDKKYLCDLVSFGLNNSKINTKFEKKIIPTQDFVHFKTLPYWFIFFKNSIFKFYPSTNQSPILCYN